MIIHSQTFDENRKRHVFRRKILPGHRDTNHDIHNNKRRHIPVTFSFSTNCPMGGLYSDRFEKKVRESKRRKKVIQKVPETYNYFCSLNKSPIFAPLNGDVAQLARALAWHARGRRFEPDLLHKKRREFKPGVFYIYNFI